MLSQKHFRALMCGLPELDRSTGQRVRIRVPIPIPIPNPKSTLRSFVGMGMGTGMGIRHQHHAGPVPAVRPRRRFIPGTFHPRAQRPRSKRRFPEVDCRRDYGRPGAEGFMEGPEETTGARGELRGKLRGERRGKQKGESRAESLGPKPRGRSVSARASRSSAGLRPRRGSHHEQASSACARAW